MSESKKSVVVSSRGQITLPAGLRRRLGIKDGGVVTIEERGSELVVRPAAVVEMTVYSDEDISLWDAEDNLTKTDSQRIREKLAPKS